MSRLLLALCVAACAATSFAADLPRVDGERSRSAPPAKLAWRDAAFDPSLATRVRFPEVPLAQLVALDDANRARDRRRPTPVQIGVGRAAPAGKAVPLELQWRAVAGGRVATLEVTSPVAMGLRAGLSLQGLPADAELRVRGSELPLGEIVRIPGAEALRALDPGGLYWTPATDGETQTIEVFVPAGSDPGAPRIAVPQVAHLVTNSRSDFKILEKLGESGACNIDTACKVGELGADFVRAKDAVAHMVFNLYRSNGTAIGAYICTGTLLNDTDPSTQVPYFWTARHCFAGGSGDVPAQDMARVAASLTTYWNYEAASCNSGTSTSRATLGGGADVLFDDEHTDAMLLRLRNPAPAGATFAGWDAAGLPTGADVVAIHHPSGDAKKVSFGRHVPADDEPGMRAVGWLSGTTEGGSSGSGLFVRGNDGSYRLHGGLYGGYAACPNSGSLADSGNRDWYSRLDLVFPRIQQYLAPVPVAPRRRNGAHPLDPRR
jgi:lysyl endopeptidase